MKRRNQLSPHVIPEVIVSDNDDKIAATLEEATSSLALVQAPLCARRLFVSEDEDTQITAALKEADSNNDLDDSVNSQLPPQVRRENNEPDERLGWSAECMISTTPSDRRSAPDIEKNILDVKRRKISQVRTAAYSDNVWDDWVELQLSPKIRSENTEQSERPGCSAWITSTTPRDCRSAPDVKENMSDGVRRIISEARTAAHSNNIWDDLDKSPFPLEERRENTEPNERPGWSGEWMTSTIPTDSSSASYVKENIWDFNSRRMYQVRTAANSNNDWNDWLKSSFTLKERRENTESNERPGWSDNVISRRTAAHSNNDWNDWLKSSFPLRERGENTEPNERPGSSDEWMRTTTPRDSRSELDVEEHICHVISRRMFQVRIAAHSNNDLNDWVKSSFPLEQRSENNESNERSGFSGECAILRDSSSAPYVEENIWVVNSRRMSTVAMSAHSNNNWDDGVKSSFPLQERSENAEANERPGCSAWMTSTTPRDNKLADIEVNVWGVKRRKISKVRTAAHSINNWALRCLPQIRSENTEPNERQGYSTEWIAFTTAPGAEVKISTSVRSKISQVTTRVSPPAEIITSTDRRKNSPARAEPLANVVSTGRPSRLGTVSEVESLQCGERENLQTNASGPLASNTRIHQRKRRPVVQLKTFVISSNAQPVASTSPRCENPNQRAKLRNARRELSPNSNIDDEMADQEVSLITSKLKAMEIYYRFNAQRCNDCIPPTRFVPLPLHAGTLPDVCDVNLARQDSINRPHLLSPLPVDSVLSPSKTNDVSDDGTLDGNTRKLSKISKPVAKQEEEKDKKEKEK